MSTNRLEILFIFLFPNKNYAFLNLKEMNKKFFYSQVKYKKINWIELMILSSY